jgi:mRNA-degrading endonuclease toxin of MazEF toxin-antitoxin module
MQKEFFEWHLKKESIDNIPERLFFHEREVWWCSLGVNVGFEQDGKGPRFARPVLIFKKFNKEVFWALPLTTKVKENRFHMSIDLDDNLPRSVIVSQIRLIDARRLLHKMCTISENNYIDIKKAVIKLCG